MDDLLDVLGPVLRKAPTDVSVEEKRSNSDTGAGAHSSKDSLRIELNQPVIRDVQQDKYYDSRGYEITDERKVCKHQVAFPSSMRSLVEQLPEDDAVFTLPRPTDMAKEFPFELDPFQVQAISAVSRNESVLVSAHTSAGKTVVAEYAIAQALRNNQRIVYTSPIKALSNQKYKDLADEFGAGNVGLRTGDTSIAPNAPVVVMTTEILRDLLYRGDDIVGSMAWVVFDEVHYMRDAERGVVWEETMIHLPQETRCVFLSATIPNAAQFAGWIASLHDRPALMGHARPIQLFPCHVIYTEYRPTPLVTYIPIRSAGESGTAVSELKCIQDSSGFHEAGFQTAMDYIARTHGVKSSHDSAVTPVELSSFSGNKGTDMDKLRQIIQHLSADRGEAEKDKTGLPIIVFAFSKREVEKNARALARALKNSPGKAQASAIGVTEGTRHMIRRIYSSAIDRLPASTRDMETIKEALPVFEAGIGVHHSGLLPTMKELTEMLFGMGLLKVLFATETFGMGLNMPARTVIFTKVTKWDGVKTRLLSSGEYIQMAGRAGRRNVDDFGRVITMISESISESECRAMIAGAADNLDSSFHMTYSTLLKMMTSTDDSGLEGLLNKTFLQYQTRDIAQTKAEQFNALLYAPTMRLKHGATESATALFAAYEGAVRAREAAQRALAPALTALAKAQAAKAAGKAKRGRRAVKTKRSDTIAQSPQKSILIGRGVFAVVGAEDWGWGLVVSDDGLGTLAVVVRCDEAGIGPYTGSGSRFLLKKIRIQDLAHVSNFVFTVPPADQATDESNWPGMFETVARAVAQVHLSKEERKAFDRHRGAKLDDLFEPLPPFDRHGSCWIGASDSPFITVKGGPEVEAYQARFKALGSAVTEVRKMWSTTVNDAGKDPRGLSRVRKELAGYEELRRRETRMTELRHVVDQGTATVLLSTVERMREVLRELGFVDQTYTPIYKGAFARNINTANELLVTEVMLANATRELTVGQTAALLATMVDETDMRSLEPISKDQVLIASIDSVRATAQTIGGAMSRAGLEAEGEEFAHRAVHLTCVPVVRAWAEGKDLSACLAANPDRDHVGSPFSYEGNVVRVLRRLVVLLEQLEEASKELTDMHLREKIRAVKAAVQRDEVSVDSLYTAED
ncbi:DEAD/DEAH box helicase [Carpediemonas membranifera]|uniref:DEAD/DEAH box helicase n=1 Tax=Carpediemonas membranifera TaxID=201153 RepID=A0A8J6BAD2_9EUKA|nr:DEAD/DEAH box helicase [Carpediemonas membranifera]|eukprot:KAG9396062.1 DEAD/DEAH box helicase [Carpediemonas membranifera]